MADTLTVDRAMLERVAAALAAYMGAMRADIPARETIMERIRSADRRAQPAYAELYALLTAAPQPVAAWVRNGSVTLVDPDTDYHGWEKTHEPLYRAPAYGVDACAAKGSDHA